MNNDTTCSLVQDLLPGYIDGVTSEKSSEFVQKHLRECEACRCVYDAMNVKSTPAQLHAEEIVREMIREKKRARRAVLLTILTLLVIAAVCLLPLPRRIQRTHQALEWRCGDREYSVSRTVMIDGIYYDYLFKEDRFKGKFVVEGYPVTAKADVYSFFTPNTTGSLWYIDANENLGGLIMRPSGKEFFVTIYESGSWNGRDGLMLTGPVDNREEAVALTNKLSRKYSKDYLARWTFE